MGPAESASATPQGSQALLREQVQTQLDRILRSALFVRSERMSRFLRFAVENALANPGSALKEYLVGVEVFDRPVDYDPQVDPIVRVEARRLRAKLKAYYAVAGSADPILIEFPKGAYAAVFRPSDPARSSVPEQPAQTAVAVLPFANLSPETGDDYFSDGLTEELILLLTRVRGLRVVAWNSASQFRGREQDLSSIREDLKAEVILRGSVRRTASRVRVTAQLIDTSSGSYLWSEGFDRNLIDVVGIQQEIARAIVETLRLGWIPAQPARSTRRPLNLDCYNLCLQARFHLNRRTQEGILQSVQCYEHAIDIDPESPVAHAGLADAYSLLSDYGVKHPREAMPLAEASAQRALELDPGSAEALSALAFIRSIFDWKWEEAEALYRRAIAVNPGYAKARHWFGVDALALLGRFDEAEAEVQLARELDPLSLILSEGIAYVRMLRGDYEGAAGELRQIAALDPAFYKAYSGLGRVFSLMGHYDEAIAMLEKAHSMAGDLPSIVGALGQVLALSGRRDQARQCLQKLELMARSRHVQSAAFAILHLGLGEIDQCLTWLETACEQHESQIVALNVHPVYADLRSEPRCQVILRRIGFLP
jgi:TolB-like protein/Flp pilus assembly protein TadD